jgi:trk system potassium uptake protein TrkH
MTVQGRRPGDRRVKVTRALPEEVRLTPVRPLRPPLPPALVLVIGFAGLISIGTLLLLLPFAASDGRWTSILDALFTATSAVCVTGLVVLDTGTYWSPFGQVVILVLIQAGGFGFMTSSTVLLILLARRRTTLRNRVLVQESLGARSLGAGPVLVRRVAIFTLFAEAIGAALLIGFALVREGPQLEDLWWGLFHAVSAFNNAGFDVNGGFASLTAFQRDWAVVGVIGVLVVIGGIGFAVVADVWERRQWHAWALETKIVIATSAALLVAGAVGIGMAEWSNPETLGSLPPAERVLNSVFHSVTPRTAGFNTLPIDGMTDQAVVMTMALMFIGGASGSTAGGIKINTFSVLGIAILSSVRGRPSAEIFGRRIPHGLIYRALSVALLYIAVAFTVALFLQLGTGTGFIETVFETLSGIGTVGLSYGITPDLPDAAQLLMTATMFVGRLGPLTLVLALAARAQMVPYRPAVETMRIG